MERTRPSAVTTRNSKEETRTFAQRAGLFESPAYRRFGRLVLPVRAAPRGEAVAAIDGFVAARLKRHFRRLSALATRRLEHLTSAASTGAPARSARSRVASAATGAAARAALRFAGRTALGATIRLVLKAFAGEKLLLAGTKNKLAVAINATQSFISVHLRVFPGGV
jgi:hypothetical protein